MPDRDSSGNITAAFQRAAEVGDYSDEIKSVLMDTAPVLFQMILKYGDPEMIHRFSRPENMPLTTKCVHLLPTRPMPRTDCKCPRSFMEMYWQHNNPPNPADAKDGPQAYDNHLYYSFGVSPLVDVSDDMLLIFVITGSRRSQSRGLLD